MLNIQLMSVIQIVSYPVNARYPVNAKYTVNAEYPVNAGVPHGSILGLVIFLLYINDLSGDLICDIAIYADNTTLYLTVIRHLICGSNLNWLLNLNLIYETLWTGVRSGLLISMLGKLSWFRLTGLITMVLLM